ncbi:5-formyltetrahydrofolate cyclo-ligase [Methanobacterium ferruginis]|uniref:5-formyltetrahydrofolate cyclo-ligase n=1 Tax=Methanobacterium ferruginis TaxID=710191 RepID=UPI002572580C|nr:5-formyltetrahydrofolate cyclo-ligase [Methanobacterium ferruginis]BDZ68375.1 hypothetical protein GCM10025860_18230 [Methanobacterium ferruginis]
MTVKDKQKVRERIWEVIEDKDLKRTSKSCFGRIPNFKGASQAALRLRKTDQWQDAETVFSSPDSALRDVREYALFDGKVLIMATPKIKEEYILLNPQDLKGHEKRASSIEGAFKLGRKIGKFPQVDLVVEGSLAVDLEGNRLGKGGGFADREISHLYSEGAINKDTPISSIVHPLQIIHQIPQEGHDQKINMIITPYTVIRISFINPIK